MTPDHDARARLLADLLGRPARPPAVADPLRPVLASLLAGRCLQLGVLSATLGLPVPAFRALCEGYFPGDPIELQNASEQNLFELEDLRDLLLAHRAGARESEVWLADIVACACGGRDHLWQDLGLAHRGELSALMSLAFPSLAALNSGDMKWKKFIYRQYCSRDGLDLCPAPSCGACAERAQCFAPET